MDLDLPRALEAPPAPVAHLLAQAKQRLRRVSRVVQPVKQHQPRQHPRTGSPLQLQFKLEWSVTATLSTSLYLETNAGILQHNLESHSPISTSGTQLLAQHAQGLMLGIMSA